jgi:hypothetical protein
VPELERIQQNTPGTLSQQWYENGAAADPGTVTVGITRADGTELVAAGTGTTGAGTNPRTFSLTTTHTALLDTLKVTWTSSAKGTLVSYLEVAGGFLFAIADARATRPLDDTTRYPTSAIIDYRTRVEEAIEDEYGTALVPRYRLATISGPGAYKLRLTDPVRAIRSVTVDGTALPQETINSLSFDDGWLSGYWWPPGTGNITVGYEYGLDRAPGRVAMDAVRLAKQWLVNGPIDDRAATFNAGADGGTYSLVVPGRGGSIFGLPDLDAVINASPYRLGVA